MSTQLISTRRFQQSQHSAPEPEPEPQPEPEPEPEPVQATPALALHPDVGRWHGKPATPAAADVPGYWFRNPRTGLLSKVPAYMEDTIRRCTSEGFQLLPDPTTTPGIPIFGEPQKKLDQLGIGPSVGVQRMN